MTLENTHFGSEYGMQMKTPLENLPWVLIHNTGEGFETYEEAYQEALEAKVDVETIRIVVYDYEGSELKNIRVLTIV